MQRPVKSFPCEFESHPGSSKQQNDPRWCNWQHVCLWSRRVLVRPQAGERKKAWTDAGLHWINKEGEHVNMPKSWHRLDDADK